MMMMMMMIMMMIMTTLTLDDILSDDAFVFVDIFVCCLQRSCEIECPLDCKLSPWTEFTSCSRQCGAGVRSRFRTVIQRATQGGHVCVSSGGERDKQITDTVACREKDCYHYSWRSDPWEECRLTNQTRGSITKCGTGMIITTTP